MRLADFFPSRIREATAGLDGRWALSIVHRFDPGASPMRSRGLFGLVFHGSRGTVWKLTDMPEEVAVAKRLMGKHTETLVPILEVHEVDDPHPRPSNAAGPLALIRTPVMQELDEGMAAAVELFRRHDPPSMDQVIEAAQLNEMGVSEFSQYVKRIRVWTRECRAECQSFGITNPDLFEGTDNIKADREGDLRLIDLGDLGEMG